MRKDFLAAGRAAARLADDKKALDVALFDVRRFSTLADFYVLASAESSTQLTALQHYIEEKLSADFDLDLVRQDGRRSSSWSVMDYGGLVIHLMHSSAREFYGLERLWENARRLPIEEPAKPAAKKRAAKAAPRGRKK